MELGPRIDQVTRAAWWWGDPWRWTEFFCDPANALGTVAESWHQCPQAHLTSRGGSYTYNSDYSCRGIGISSVSGQSINPKPHRPRIRATSWSCTRTSISKITSWTPSSSNRPRISPRGRIQKRLAIAERGQRRRDRGADQTATFIQAICDPQAFQSEKYLEEFGNSAEIWLRWLWTQACGFEEERIERAPHA